MSQLSRRRRILIGLLAVIGSLAAITYYFVGNPFDPFDNKRFFPESWRQATDAYDLEARARMCRDLMKRFIHAGMSEQEIVALLGKPDQIQEGKDRDRSIGTRSYRYGIGNWSLERMDDAFLYVHFDSNGRVVGREIYGY